MQGNLKSAITAHGIACDESIPALLGNTREETGANGRKLLGNIGIVPKTDVHVRIPSEMAGGHDDGDSPLGGISFYGSIALPSGLIVGHTVKQIQNRVFFRFIQVFNADLPLCFLGKNHIDLGAHFQDFGKEIHMY